MVEAGILQEDDRVELIEGTIVEMSPIGEAHVWCVNRLTQLFGTLQGRAILQVQSPIRLGLISDPQPDIVLLRWRADLYPPGAPPSPGDVLLVVEVADTSLVYDRDTKIPLYARAGIQEGWLLDIPGRRLIVGREPGPQGYQDTVIFAGAQPLSPLAFPDVRLTAEELLPPAA